jgi:hypothetical protein
MRNSSKSVSSSVSLQTSWTPEASFSKLSIQEVDQGPSPLRKVHEREEWPSLCFFLLDLFLAICYTAVDCCCRSSFHTSKVPKWCLLPRTRVLSQSSTWRISTTVLHLEFVPPDQMRRIWVHRPLTSPLSCGQTQCPSRGEEGYSSRKHPARYAPATRQVPKMESGNEGGFRGVGVRPIQAVHLKSDIPAL